MVSYYNHMAMYRQQPAVMPPQPHFNNGSSGPSGWYPYGNNSPGHQHHQQLLNCMQEGVQESAGQQMPWAHSVFHPHHPQEYLEQKYILPHQLPAHSQHPLVYEQGPVGLGPHEPPPQLPSPPTSLSELSSPGGNLTPPQQQGRPQAIRSPFDWMTKPNYQTQPNPGEREK